MVKLLIFLAAYCCCHTAEASFGTDTSFISLEAFEKLSNKEIKQRFATDDTSKAIVNDFYRSRSKGLLWLIPSVLLNAGGVYFSIFSSNATNGMVSTVGLVIAIALFIPGIISLFNFGKRFLFRKKASKKILYDRLRAHYKK